MIRQLLEEARRALPEAQTVHLKGAPADVNRYYEECMEKQKGKGKEYCARVAWQRYCMYKNPGYKGCTEFGKTKKSLPIKGK